MSVCVIETFCIKQADDGAPEEPRAALRRGISSASLEEPRTPQRPHDKRAGHGEEAKSEEAKKDPSDEVKESPPQNSEAKTEAEKQAQERTLMGAQGRADEQPLVGGLGDEGTDAHGEGAAKGTAAPLEVPQVQKETEVQGPATKVHEDKSAGGAGDACVAAFVADAWSEKSPPPPRSQT